MINSRVLIVTNEEKVAHDLRERLLKLGYKVVGIATSNEDVISKIKDSKPELILTDIRLNGERGGIKTGQLIHTNYDIPIIYITGSVGETTIQRAKSTGPFGYVFKPFDEKQIYATIETALLRHHLESELREGRQWLNAVLDGINDGVIALDNQGTIRFINPIATQLTGWSELETIGRTLYEVFALVDEFSHERVEVLGIKSDGAKFEGLLLSKKGKSTFIEADSTIINDEKAMTVGIVLVFRDITKRREAMREIQRQNQRTEALVETAARLNTQLEWTAAFNTICDVCNQALNANATGIFLQNSKQDTFDIMMTRTPITHLKKIGGIPFEISGSALRSILTERNPVVFINDIQSLSNIPYLDVLKELNIHTTGIAGLYRRQELIGVLISIYTGDPAHLPEDTIMLFKGLADQAAISITNASLFEQVRKSREHQKELTTKLVEIQETERRHIARELHDQIGQVLTGLQFMLEASKNKTGEIYKSELIEAQATVSGLIEQIREMSLNLRPAMLDDIGLLPTLLWHFERYTKQTGIRVSFHHNGITKRFSPNVETAVYRIIQEALTNIARHAQVTEAFVQLTLRNNILGVEIIDHGVGFDLSVDTSKWSTAGMAGMRERANMLGGYLVVKSAQDTGTQILATISLDRQPVERRNRDRNFAAS
jgi:PAS domain S-box-containing protein